MALSDTFRVDKSFKHAFDYTQTEAFSLGGKRWYEEKWMTKHEMAASELFASTIPYNDPSGAVAAGVAKKWDIQLTPDPSTGGDKCWVFCSTPGDINTRITDLIHPIKYGQNFSIQLRDNTGSPIHATWDWTADYTAGIIVFENPPTYPKPYYGVAWEYTGEYSVSAGSGSTGICRYYSDTITTWTPDGVYWYSDINHGLNTPDILIQIRDATTEESQEIQRYKILNNNTVRLWVPSGSSDMDVTIIGCANWCLSYTGTISSWINDGSYQYNDVTHNLGTSDILLQIRDAATDEYQEIQRYKILDPNSVRIWVISGTSDIDVAILGCPTGSTISSSSPYIETITPQIGDTYWNVNHNLSRQPVIVKCYDIYNNEIEPVKIDFIDDNTIHIFFDKPKATHRDNMLTVPAGTVVVF